MTEYDKQAASALLSSLYLSYERVLRAERTITPSARQNRLQKAKNDPNNKIIWGVVGLNGTPTSDDLQRMTIQLNQMGVKSASGMEFTPERLRSTYHNLKRIYK